MGAKSQKISYALIGLLGIGLLYCGYQLSTYTQTTLLAFQTNFISSLLDVGTYFPIALLIVVLFVISSEQRKRARKNREMLRNALTINSETPELALDIEQLKEKRTAKMSELSKAAEFGRLSQGLLHDLVTPLTSIMLHTEEFKNAKSLKASRKLASYIKDIRSTLSREESEKLCRVEEELETVIHLLAYKLQSENIELNIKKIRAKWYGNPLKLQQIFLNLISNSIDSFEGITREKKKVIVSIEEAGNTIVIKVEDNGSGIPKENIEKIFSPFFTTKPPDKGTGIGLSTVKSIVEKDLKGIIDVESEEGRGTTFTIKFPK